MNQEEERLVYRWQQENERLQAALRRASILLHRIKGVDIYVPQIHDIIAIVDDALEPKP